MADAPFHPTPAHPVLSRHLADGSMRFLLTVFVKPDDIWEFEERPYRPNHYQALHGVAVDIYEEPASMTAYLPGWGHNSIYKDYMFDADGWVDREGLWAAVYNVLRDRKGR